MDLAEENDLHSIAFPAISTGVYGYPLPAATEIAVATVQKWMKDHPEYPIEVFFSCFDGRTEEVYREILNA